MIYRPIISDSIPTDYGKTPSPHQSGIILIFTLVLLSVLSIVILNASNSSLLAEKMSGNYRDSETAHQAAESALREAAVFIDELVSKSTLNNNNGLLSEGSDPDNIEPDYRNQNTWENEAQFTRTNSFNTNTLADTPKYIIKHLGKQKICNPSNPIDLNSRTENTQKCYREIFKITAQGTGRSLETKKILQAFYEREVL
jgi:type IV pilus assembly protein PilX